MEQGPIFIGGMDRSGKTYLRFMLSAHPNIAVSRRTNLWPNFYNRYGDLSRTENFERCLAALLRYKHVAYLKPDAERLRREFWQGPPTYGHLFGLIHEQYAEREGKPRWGDQTMLLERYAAEVFAAYPDAKMIQLIRDPRDRYEAALARAPKRRERIGEATARWLYSAGLAQRNLRQYPGRYLVVRYEAMVSQPEATLREVCAFLGEAYVPAMITLEDVPRFRDRMNTVAGHGSGQSPLSTEYIGRYRQAIPMREIAFMQRHVGREMVAQGYSLDDLRFSLGERLRFAIVDTPANLTRMTLWRAREAIQYRFPARAGRKPAARQPMQRPSNKPDGVETV